MSFSDALKKSVLEGFTAGDLTTTKIIVALGMAAVIGLYIFFVYRLTTKSNFYSRSFNKSLAVLPVITTVILLAMSSNIVISLGMVGALSIVRFRNAVKDSMDLTFLFWSISAGIVIGAGLYELAVVASLVISLFMAFLDVIPSFKAPCLMVISAENSNVETAIMKVLKSHTKKVSLRSRNITLTGMELIFELQVKDYSALSDEISQIAGVTSTSVLSHNGELRI